MVTTYCIVCGKKHTYKLVGKFKFYCSVACRQEAYRIRNENLQPRSQDKKFVKKNEKNKVLVAWRKGQQKLMDEARARNTLSTLSKGGQATLKVDV